MSNMKMALLAILIGIVAASDELFQIASRVVVMIVLIKLVGIL